MINSNVLTISLTVVVLFSVSFMSPVSEANENRITMCIDHYPPYHLFPEDGGRPYGVNISIVEAVTQKLGLQLEFTKDTPFKRCLRYMETGQVDIMGGLLHTPERAEVMHLLEYMGKSKKMFLVKKGSDLDITTLEDLKGLNVGTVLGFKYFSEFDKDEAIQQSTSLTLEIAIKKLLLDRVDAVIASDAQYNSLFQKNNELLEDTQLCSYIYNEYTPVHIGISKASKYGQGEWLEKFTQTVQELYESGEIFTVREDFYQQFYKDQAEE